MTTDGFDFRTPVDRWGTHSAKWDLLAAPYGRDAVALSVADMEFRTAPAVIEAVENAAKLGMYGYTEVFDDFRRAAADWQRRRHGWNPDPDDLVFFPRIVQCVAALTNFIIPDRTGRRARVVSFTPAYHPSSKSASGRAPPSNSSNSSTRPRRRASISTPSNQR